MGTYHKIMHFIRSGSYFTCSILFLTTSILNHSGPLYIITAVSFIIGSTIDLVLDGIDLCSRPNVQKQQLIDR